PEGARRIVRAARDLRLRLREPQADDSGGVRPSGQHLGERLARGDPIGRPRKHEAPPVRDPVHEAGRRPDNDLWFPDDQVASAGMSSREFLFTSDPSTKGHPAKVANEISDPVLDAVLRDDVNGRVACETLIT